MGFLDLYRVRKPKEDDPELEGEPEEELEPLPKLTPAEFWPPSPRVKILYIGAAFVAFNFLLICVALGLIWARYG